MTDQQRNFQREIPVPETFSRNPSLPLGRLVRDRPRAPRTAAARLACAGRPQSGYDEVNTREDHE